MSCSSSTMMLEMRLGLGSVIEEPIKVTVLVCPDDVEPKHKPNVQVSTAEVLTAVELGGSLCLLEPPSAVQGVASIEWVETEHKPLLTVSNEVKMFDELSTPIKEELDGFDDSTVVPLEDDLIKGSGEIQEFDEMLVPTAEVIDGEKINSELGEIMDKGSVFEGCDRVENMRICRQFSKVTKMVILSNWRAPWNTWANIVMLNQET
ncbi:hypothetical protein V6N12_017190 [Hibiscus sabdariffa]|uniref:Uncharacterized protein n=1 Tax=Hibiscus sabdariffa TaxID=183260 RepID=A0ABR2AI96_9ROSI